MECRRNRPCFNYIYFITYLPLYQVSVCPHRPGPSWWRYGAPAYLEEVGHDEEAVYSREASDQDSLSGSTMTPPDESTTDEEVPGNEDLNQAFEEPGDEDDEVEDLAAPVLNFQMAFEAFVAGRGGIQVDIQLQEDPEGDSDAVEEEEGEANGRE